MRKSMFQDVMTVAIGQIMKQMSQRETSLHSIIHNTKLFSVSYSSFSAASVGDACIQRSRGFKGNDNGPTISYHSITNI